MKDLKARINHCYNLANKGSIDLAEISYKRIIRDIYEKDENIFQDPVIPKDEKEQIFKSLEKTSALIGFNNGMRYARNFYEINEKKTAREWLRFAKRHARKINYDSNKQISKIKRKYRDYIPLFF